MVSNCEIKNRNQKCRSSEFIIEIVTKIENFDKFCNQNRKFIRNQSVSHTLGDIAKNLQHWQFFPSLACRRVFALYTQTFFSCPKSTHIYHTLPTLLNFVAAPRFVIHAWLNQGSFDGTDLTYRRRINRQFLLLCQTHFDYDGQGNKKANLCTKILFTVSSKNKNYFALQGDLFHNRILVEMLTTGVQQQS